MSVKFVPADYMGGEMMGYPGWHCTDCGNTWKDGTPWVHKYDCINSPARVATGDKLPPSDIRARNVRWTPDRTMFFVSDGTYEMRLTPATISELYYQANLPHNPDP